MSNTEPQPEAVICRAGKAPDGALPVEIITSRDVPLGGPRAMTVHRTLPQRQRSLIGAWCFIDHYGPDDVSTTGGMDVAPHPHTGLQTVSWLFEGEIQHIDSGGNRGLVLPGEVNLMTAGRGICHSETSTEKTTKLHGVQLWLALPDSVRNTAPRRFEHFEPERVDVPGGSLLVFLGSLAGSTSPVTTHTPILGAELIVEPGETVTLDVDPTFEHGLLADSEGLHLEGVAVPRTAVGYTGVGATQLRIANTNDSAPARALLLGGEPFGEDIVMWWNFVGRSSEEITEFRNAWQERTEQFGQVEGYVGHGGEGRNADGLSWLPAPKLPKATLRARRNPAPNAQPDEPQHGQRTETTTLPRH
ncbi:pirin family protein [Corynebacterium urogenitale]